MTSRKYGVVQGKPCRFSLGHQTRIRPPLIDEPEFFVLGDPCRSIPLTRGQVTIVDAENYKALMFWKWCAKWDQKGRRFYAVRSEQIDGKTLVFYMHRVIAGAVLDPRDSPLDHANGKSLDNRKRNLRSATTVQNQQNSCRPITNRSGYKGVSFHEATGKWVAQIMDCGKKRHLGIFSTPDEAYVAYCNAADIFHGEFARIA